MEYMPVKIEWLMTRRCNIKCNYCKIRDPSTLRGKEMTTDQKIGWVKYVSKTFPKVQMVGFGGEPTLQNDLPEIIRTAREYSVPLAIISNGKRVVEEEGYAESLIDAGLDNWSISLDYLPKEIFPNTQMPQPSDPFTAEKSLKGLLSSKKMKDLGVRDLVTCITVSKENIEWLPAMADALTSIGVWSIFTALQVDRTGKKEYSGGDPSMLPEPYQIEIISKALAKKVRAGKNLMHNTAEYFERWNDLFLKQDWKCTEALNRVLTVDADGSFRRCVDMHGDVDGSCVQGLRLDRTGNPDLTAEEEEEFWNRFIRSVDDTNFVCQGCFWDPKYEAALKCSTMPYEDVVATYRHDEFH